MKLSLKLPLVFTASLLLLFAAALFGIGRLNQALDTYQTSVAQSFEHERMASGMLYDFKVQVQEWKNILLRGDDAQLLARHHAAFAKQDAETEALLKSVSTQAKALGFDADAGRADDLIAGHEALTRSYEATLQEMQGTAATLDAGTARAIDVKLRGADRSLEAGIGTLARDIGAASDAKREALLRGMADRYAALHWFIISVILGALAVMGFVLYRLLRATRT